MMTYSYRLRCCIIVLLFAGLSACRPAAKPAAHAGKTAPVEVGNMTPKEQAAVAGLQWLNGADPAADAANEISAASAESRKVNLLAFARRSISYPGLSKAQLAALGDKVGYRFAPGSGDVIYGPTHRTMRRTLRSYAIAYNQAIFAALQ